MPVHKVLIGTSAALAVVGILLRLVGLPVGTDLLILAVLTAVGSLIVTQRNAQNHLATTRRSLTQRIRVLGELQSEHSELLSQHSEKIDDLAALERTTLWYAKQRARSTPDSPVEVRPSRRAGKAGRASTPEVSNAGADMSFVSALDPSRAPRVTGVLAPRTLGVLPAGVEVTAFLPGHAEEALTVETPPDIIVIDEAALEEAPWDRAVGPAGISMMRDLIAATRCAHESGIQTVVVPHGSVPDIHSRALRIAPALRLPMTEEVRGQAAGARQTAVLVALDDLARSESDS